MIVRHGLTTLQYHRCVLDDPELHHLTSNPDYESKLQQAWQNKSTESFRVYWPGVGWITFRYCSVDDKFHGSKET